MDELEKKIRELETKLLDEIENMENSIKNSKKDEFQLDSNDVRAIIDQLLTEKGFVTQTELEQKVDQKHLQLIKWIVGTGLSSIAIVFSLVRYII
ncbi:hypothetical protein [Virgibacillus sp. DJP39]|uniref:hypothetical protein n=1 Tax=Virgibacillus sp. DJP39 TaxID=3409790 RepID=UPI003BB7B6EA